MNFWLSNKSNRYIHIHDLGINFAPNMGINLAKLRISKEKIEKSINEGDLFKNKNSFIFSDKPILRKKPQTHMTVSKRPIPLKARSVVDVVKSQFEEMDFDESELLKDE